ncbi:MAG TPA: MBL fold metallo-hydrolase [Synergistaceae bacterium]|nr:MBL fold metallo-hydrolase [Synergistaceae bacterium]HPJ25339.1 MBL fold metallo-hydrolase [Synergistaceae bacterium]HPQ36661.1 MBL fold metallo-hydrolase [Synergistaceae bacterium]
MASKLELRHLRGESYYIPGAVNLGLYGPPSATILLDSGNDESSGRKVYRLLEEEGRTLKLILNTHSHADHIGGNAYLQKKTACSIGAPFGEASFIEDPSLEPSFLWGASPFKELRNKFLQAAPSKVFLKFSSEGPVEETELTAFPLKGHSLEMAGFRTPDEVFYLGDSLFSEEIIEKYRLLFALNIREWLETLEKLRHQEAAYFVPCHAEPCEDIASLVTANRRALLSLTEDVLALCEEPRGRDGLVTSLFRRYNLKMNPSQYVLGTSTVSACLTYLMEEGVLEVFEENSGLFWRKTS